MENCKQPSSFDFFKRFPDEDSARLYLEKARWPNGIVCLNCQHNDVWKIRGGKIYTCKKCRTQFTIRTGTVMEDSKLSLQKWIYAMYLMTTARKGISSIQLSKELGITQKSAWFVEHRIRESCKSSGLLTGTVEVDETYIGGKEKNKHKSKKLHAGRGAVGKSIVFGVKSRDGETQAKVISGTTKEHLGEAITESVAEGAILYSDDFKSYTDLAKYHHETVNHSGGEYVRGDAHINSIESFWAILKRAHMGTFHHWSKKHLDRYVQEFVFKANTVNLPAFDKTGTDCGATTIRAHVAGMVGRRLTYKELIS